MEIRRSVIARPNLSVRSSFWLLASNSISKRERHAGGKIPAGVPFPMAIVRAGRRGHFHPHLWNVAPDPGGFPAGDLLSRPHSSLPPPGYARRRRQSETQGYYKPEREAGIACRVAVTSYILGVYTLGDLHGHCEGISVGKQPGSAAAEAVSGEVQGSRDLSPWRRDRAARGKRKHGPGIRLACRLARGLRHSWPWQGPPTKAKGSVGGDPIFAGHQHLYLHPAETAGRSLAPLPKSSHRRSRHFSYHLRRVDFR